MKWKLKNNHFKIIFIFCDKIKINEGMKLKTQRKKSRREMLHLGGNFKKGDVVKNCKPLTIREK